MGAPGQAPVGYQYDAASRLLGVTQGLQTVALDYDLAANFARMMNGTTGEAFTIATTQVPASVIGRSIVIPIAREGTAIVVPQSLLPLSPAQILNFMPIP
jgi:YD repeat-containing protein